MSEFEISPRVILVTADIL